MKYALVGIAAVILLWVGIVFLYGSQINVVYLCSRASEVKQRYADQLDSPIIADEINAAVYAPELQRLFAAVNVGSLEQRTSQFQRGLVEIMGPEYECPVLLELTTARAD
jgi:hypothetical protein